MAIPRAVALYYKSQSGVHLETLLEMRTRILSIIPDAKEVIKYQMPTFVVDGVDVCGLLANKNHIGYYPYSGSILDKFDELDGKYVTTKGSLHIPLGKPLPTTLIRKLIRAKLSSRPVVQRTAKKPTASDEVWLRIGLAAPARRALTNAKISNIKQLTKFSREEIAALHGMGPNAMKLLISAMKKDKLRFRHD